MQQQHIEKLIQETMDSFDGAERATTKPYLLTRILAGMKNQPDTQNAWTKMAAIISKPGIALTGLLLILLLNAAIIFGNTGNENPVQNLNTSKDEFAINVISIYDNENQEP